MSLSYSEQILGRHDTVCRELSEARLAFSVARLSRDDDLAIRRLISFVCAHSAVGRKVVAAERALRRQMRQEIGEAFWHTLKAGVLLRRGGPLA